MKTRGEQTAAEALETNKGSIIYHALHSGNLTVDVERWVAEYGGGGNGGSKTGPKRGPSANAGHGGGGGAGGGKLYGGLAMLDPELVRENWRVLRPAVESVLERTLPRFGRAFEKIGGLGVVGVFLSGVAVLEEKKFLTEGQAGWIHTALIGGMVAADAGFLVSFIGAALPAGLGHHYAVKAAEAAGVQDPLAKTLAGIWGGLVGFEAGDYVLKHFKPYNRVRNSVAQYGNSVIKEGTIHFARNAVGQMARTAQTVEEGLTQTWQNGRTGLSLFGRQAVQTVRQAGPAATALLAGGAAALKTGALAAGEAVLGSAAAAGSAAVAGGTALGAGIYLSGLGNLLGTTQLGEYIVDDWMKTFN